MDKNIETVENLFSQERIIGDMRDYTQKGLEGMGKEVAASFSAKASILDIGCGMGREAFCLYDQGFGITAVDISEKVIEAAKQFAEATHRNILFLKTDGLHLPFDHNTFDVVIIWAQTFGLFYGQENQLSILKECHRVLNSGGLLSFSGHDRAFIEHTYQQCTQGKKFFAYADTDCYWEMFDADEMMQLAQKAGFQEAGCKEGVVYRDEDGPILHCECRKGF